jgi:hypothetical protein
MDITRNLKGIFDYFNLSQYNEMHRFYRDLFMPSVRVIYTVHVVVFWGVTSCSLSVGIGVSEENTASTFRLT